MDKRETTHTWLVLDADPRHMEQSTDDCTSRVWSGDASLASANSCLPLSKNFEHGDGPTNSRRCVDWPAWCSFGPRDGLI